MSTALIIVDLQNDFLPPDGALAVPGGRDVIEPIMKMLDEHPKWIAFATQDWHPPDHSSFKVNGGPWPEHCVQRTLGARLYPSIKPYLSWTIWKGAQRNEDGYSAFEGGDLLDILHAENVSEIHVVGLALDYCVKATALDAMREGFDVFVHLDATRPVSPDTGLVAVAELKLAGVEVVGDWSRSARIEARADRIEAAAREVVERETTKDDWETVSAEALNKLRDAVDA